MPPYTSDRSGTVFLVVVAVLFGIGGLVFASQATAGVAAIAFACLLAILARIEQAGRHHHELMAPRRQAQEATHLQQLSPAELEAIQRRQWLQKRIAFYGIGGVILLVVVVRFLSAFVDLQRSSEPSSASVPGPGDSIALDVTTVDGRLAITNRTDYLLNVCWAERNRQRASVPTMMAGATVIVPPESFEPVERAYAGGDVRITCSAGESNIQAVVR